MSDKKIIQVSVATLTVTRVLVHDDRDQRNKVPQGGGHSI
jgi:hypothetical protein